MKLKLAILFLILILLTTTGFGCKGGDTVAKKALLEPVPLKIWGLFDSSDAFTEIINAYRLTHPNVTLVYQKLAWEEYEKKLVDAWSEGTGPDIFLVHNTWVDKYQNKILPLPAILKLPVVVESGWLKKEKKAVIQEFPTLTAYQLRDLFPDVVYADAVREDKIYGLPLSIDTLAIFYNRQHLNAAGLSSVPKTWQELVEAVPKLTKQDDKGSIIQSAVSLGGANNINRSNDILSLLMLQNGTTMTDSRGQVAFNKENVNQEELPPGEHALKFYTDFALPSQEVYTWNETLPEALELFSAGKLSILFGYTYQLPIIKTQAPKINLGVAAMPHINADGTDATGVPINLANYWLYSVFKNTPHPNEAWDFINFMAIKTVKDEKGQTIFNAEKYLAATNKPPALKSLIGKYKTQSQNPELLPFINQILTATNWYHGKNPDYMNQVFKQMISNVIQGKMSVHDALNSAARAIKNNY